MDANVSAPAPFPWNSADTRTPLRLQLTVFTVATAPEKMASKPASMVHHTRRNEGPNQKRGQGQRTGNQV